MFVVVVVRRECERRGRGVPDRGGDVALALESRTDEMVRDPADTRDSHEDRLGSSSYSLDGVYKS